MAAGSGLPFLIIWGRQYRNSPVAWDPSVECLACHRKGKLLLVHRERRYHLFRFGVSPWRTVGHRYNCEQCGFVRPLRPEEAAERLARVKPAQQEP